MMDDVNVCTYIRNFLSRCKLTSLQRHARKKGRKKKKMGIASATEPIEWSRISCKI